MTKSHEKAGRNAGFTSFVNNFVRKVEKLFDVNALTTKFFVVICNIKNYYYNININLQIE